MGGEDSTTTRQPKRERIGSTGELYQRKDEKTGLRNVSYN